jgi:hypothetical protein
MNLLLRLFTVGTLLTASVSFAADAFQGKVSLAISGGKGKAQTLHYSIKDQKLRMDMEAEGQTMASIMDMEKLEMLMLMPEQKMYMVMPIKKPMEKAIARAEKQPDSTADIEITGKTETILGYKCNQMIVRDKGTVTEVWMAEGLGAFMGMGQGGGGGGPMGGMFGGGRKQSAAEAKWEEALKGKGGFPLRVITLDKKSKETFRMEATKIEPGTLPASLFLPPAGYEKFQMPNMGDMLKGFGG